jgi:hypothetical protein
MNACTALPPVSNATTAPPSASDAIPSSTATTAVGAGPRDADASVAWQQLRQQVPADIAVVRPTYLPSGLPLTVTYTYASGSEGWRYAVAYRAASETTVTFILGLVNSGFAERQESITVRGQSGLLAVSSQFPRLQITWVENGRRYYIQANGITEDDIKRIAAGLIEQT